MIKIRKFWTQIKSKQTVMGAIIIGLMIVISAFSFATLVPETVEAGDGFDSEFEKQDLGTISCVATHDGGNFSTNEMFDYYGDFYSNSTGRYYFSFGGTNNAESFKTDQIVRTNLNTNVSEVVAYLPTRAYTVGVVLDEQNTTFYLIGGRSFSGAFLDTINAYNISNNTVWNTGATIPVAQQQLGRGVWANETCYLFCGGDNGGKTYDVVAYCPGNNTAWTDNADISGVVGDIKVPAVAYCGTGNDIYLFGGDGSPDSDKIVGYSFVNHTAWLEGTLTIRGITARVYAVYNSINDTYIIGPSGVKGTDELYITSINATTWTEYYLNNNTYGGECAIDFDLSYRLLIGPGSTEGPYYNNTICVLDMDLEPESTDSVYTIKGLQNNRITWAGTAGTTVYCNESGDYNEWLEINMSINSSDNVTEIRVFMDDLNVSTGLTEFINASNITMYVSSDNSSYGEMGTFSDGGSNISINSTTWNVGTMGANPFAGAGLTDKNTSIYCIFKLDIPTSATTNIFYTLTATANKIYLGHYV